MQKRNENVIVEWTLLSKTLTGLQCVTFILEQLGFEFMLKRAEKLFRMNFFNMQSYMLRSRRKKWSKWGLFCTNSKKSGYLILQLFRPLSISLLNSCSILLILLLFLISTSVCITQQWCICQECLKLLVSWEILISQLIFSVIGTRHT